MKSDVPFEKKYKQRTITGGWMDSVETQRHAICGYCHYKNHSGYLLKRHMKSHNCIAKKCHYLELSPNMVQCGMSTQDTFAREKKEYSKIISKLWKNGDISNTMYIAFEREVRNVKRKKELHDIIKVHQMKIMARNSR